MNETGMSKREATEYVHEVSAFSGADYENFTAGYRKAEEEIINNGLLKSQPFNGTMYRGIALDDVDYYAFIENVEVGSTMRMKSISSWSSNIDVAVGYSAQQDIGDRRVIFVNKKNKTASSIKHISSVPSEDEVLAPSTAKWKVTEIKSSSDSLGRYTLVEVEEI